VLDQMGEEENNTLEERNGDGCDVVRTAHTEHSATYNQYTSK
jgi:hypothetical protein